MLCPCRLPAPPAETSDDTDQRDAAGSAMVTTSLLRLPCFISSFPISHPSALSSLGKKDLNCSRQRLTSLVSSPRSGQNRYFPSALHVDQDPPLGKICHLSHAEGFWGDCSPIFWSYRAVLQLVPLSPASPKNLGVLRINEAD